MIDDPPRAETTLRAWPRWLPWCAVVLLAAAVVAGLASAGRRGPPPEVWVRDDVPSFADLRGSVALSPAGDPPDVYWITAQSPFALEACERDPGRPLGELQWLVAPPTEFWFVATDDVHVVDGRAWRRHRLGGTRPYSPFR